MTVSLVLKEWVPRTTETGRRQQRTERQTQKTRQTTSRTRRRKQTTETRKRSAHVYMCTRGGQRGVPVGTDWIEDKRPGSSRRFITNTDDRFHQHHLFTVIKLFIWKQFLFLPTASNYILPVPCWDCSHHHGRNNSRTSTDCHHAECNRNKRRATRWLLDSATNGTELSACLVGYHRNRIEWRLSIYIATASKRDQRYHLAHWTGWLRWLSDRYTIGEGLSHYLRFFRTKSHTFHPFDNTTRCHLHFFDEKSQHEEWVKKWPKVKNVYTQIEPICQALELVMKQCNLNFAPVSFAQVCEEDASDINLNQLLGWQLSFYVFFENSLEHSRKF